MLTVAKALQELDVFTRARVVAGSQGLEHEIRWVHIVDIPDASAWVNGGELLLTTAFGLKDDVLAQDRLVPQLAEKGLAGLVVAVGRYLKRIPDEMVRSADAFAFPIVELPFDVPFVQVTRAVIDRIESEHYALQQKALSIHATLTELVIEGGGLDVFARTLADLVQRSIAVEDENFELLAYTTCGEVDEARRTSIAEGRTPADLLGAIEQAGVFDEIRRSRRPQRIAPIPEYGMTMERIVAPIVAGGEVHGYVWIIAGSQPLSDLDFLAIEQAAMIAALILVKERAVRDAENRTRGGLLSQLLAPDFLPTSAWEERARRYGFDAAKAYQVLVVRSRNGLGTLARTVEKHGRDWAVKVLVAEQADALVMVIESTDKDNAATLADALHTTALSQGMEISGGLGRVVVGAENFRQSYSQASEALRIGSTMGAGRWLTRFEDLGFLHWVYHLPADVYQGNPYQDYVRALAGHPDLLLTLEAYLDNGRIAKKTAEQLFLHRNTLAYRLKRIERLCQVSLSDPVACLNLHLALKSRRLRDSQAPPS